jgi:hypothetical protein
MDYSTLSIKELKAFLAAEGISTFGLIEKSEFVARAVLTGKGKGTNQMHAAGGGGGGSGGGTGGGGAGGGGVVASSDAGADAEETICGPCIKCPKGTATGKPCGTFWGDSKCVAFVCDKHAINCDGTSCELDAHLCSKKCAEPEGFEEICPCGTQLCTKCMERYTEEIKEYDGIRWSEFWREDCKHYVCFKCYDSDCLWCKSPTLPRKIATKSRRI